MNEQNEQKHKNDRQGMLIGGIIITGIGILFLLSNLRIIPSIGELWPVFMIIVGIAVIVGAFAKKKNNGN